MARGENDADRFHKRFGRIGFAAKGFLYGIIGLLAIAVAAGEQKRAAGQQGALRSLADDGGLGELGLIALAVGLGAYAAYRFGEIFLGGPSHGEGGREKLERAASLARALIYGALCVTAIRLLTESAGSSTGPRQSTSTVFDLPAGQALVIGAGAVLIGVGLYQAYLAWSGSFTDDLDTPSMSEAERHTVRVAGTVGHGARTVYFTLIGAFLVKAGVEHDPKDAIGLDGALQKVAAQELGPLLLGVLAAGLIVYGAFCLFEAAYLRD